MIQIGILGIVGALLAIQFKSTKGEYGIYLGIAVSLMIFFSILSQLKIFTDAVRQIGQYVNLDSYYMGTLLKMLGITYVAEFASAICKDAGHQTIVMQIEIFGKLVILALGIPVLLALLETIKEFLS